MAHAVESDIGAVKRESNSVNEDSVGVTPLSLTVHDTTHQIEIVVVADGAGGHDAGDIASYLTVRRVLEFLTSAFVLPDEQSDAASDTRSFLDDPLSAADEECESLITAAIQAAHQDVLEYCVNNRTKAHTTAIVTVRIGDQLHYGWVGDSPAYLINQKHDRIEQLTRDHSVVREKVEQGHIDQTAALVDPQGNQLQRALGGSQYADPDTSTIEVDTGSASIYQEDIVLVASDGLVDAHAVGSRSSELFDAYQSADEGSVERQNLTEEIQEFAVTESEIKSIVTTADSLPTAAEDLIDMANSYGGKDNVTVALLAAESVPKTPDTLPPRSEVTETDLSTAPTVIAEVEESAGGDHSTCDN